MGLDRGRIEYSGEKKHEAQQGTRGTWTTCTTRKIEKHWVAFKAYPVKYQVITSGGAAACRILQADGANRLKSRSTSPRKKLNRGDFKLDFQSVWRSRRAFSHDREWLFIGLFQIWGSCDRHVAQWESLAANNEPREQVPAGILGSNVLLCLYRIVLGMSVGVYCLPAAPPRYLISVLASLLVVIRHVPSVRFRVCEFSAHISFRSDHS